MLEEKTEMVVSALSVAAGAPYPCQGPGLNGPEVCPPKAQLQWGGIGNKALPLYGLPRRASQEGHARPLPQE